MIIIPISVVRNVIRTERALEFKDRYDEIWIGLGRTESWEDEEQPPSLSGNEGQIDDLFGFVKSEVNLNVVDSDKCVFVKEDDDGDVIYNYKRYRMIKDKHAKEEGATKLYFRIKVRLDFFEDVDSYRQFGIYVDLEKDSSVSDDRNHLIYPDEVEDVGRLYSIYNTKPIIRPHDKSEVVKFIIDF